MRTFRCSFFPSPRIIYPSDNYSLKRTDLYLFFEDLGNLIYRTDTIGKIDIKFICKSHSFDINLNTKSVYWEVNKNNEKDLFKNHIDLMNHLCGKKTKTVKFDMFLSIPENKQLEEEIDAFRTRYGHHNTYSERNRVSLE